MRYRNIFILAAFLVANVSAESVYVRVSQVGYETGKGPFRAYLMSKQGTSATNFKVVNSAGQTLVTSPIGALLGTWVNSATLTYNIYALDFTVPGGDTYTISIPGHPSATSPAFAVNAPSVLYPGLLLNTKFFYQTQRDGPNYIANALRSAPGHLNDQNASVYLTPPLDSNDSITTMGTPLTATGKVIDASGGWWDAGDYMKYVETISYTVALQEIGVRDFPNQMGPNAPHNPPAPPASVSYAGNAAGPPANTDFSAEAEFGIRFLLKMWDDKSSTLYYQVGNSQDWNNFSYLSDYDIWRLPQADDNFDGCSSDATFICHRPVFVAGTAGSPVSPNLAGRMAAAFAVCYQLNRTTKPDLANQCLKSAEDIFALADTSFAEPAPSVNGGTCTNGCLLTILPFDGYGETVWSDDMELGATELYLALQCAGKPANLPAGLPQTNPNFYLKQAAQFAQNYINHVYNIGAADTLNLYDVSGLAHFELFRAIKLAGNPSGLAIGQTAIKNQFLKQVGDAITHAASDAWGFGVSWNGDTTAHGAGISVMASQAHYLTNSAHYDNYSQRWLANILGANAWGSSFIVGDGSTFPNCIQHQAANLAGALNGTSGGTPVLWGAVSEGPAFGATSGALDGMLKCPPDGGNAFKIFDDPSIPAIYKDNVQSYSTTEPAIDLTATSFLMWSWRMAGSPNGWLQ